MKGLFDGFSDALDEIKREFEKAARELETTQMPKGQVGKTGAKRQDNAVRNQTNSNQNKAKQVSVEDIIKGLDKGFRNYDEQKKAQDAANRPKKLVSDKQQNLKQELQRKQEAKKKSTKNQSRIDKSDRLQRSTKLSDRDSNLESKIRDLEQDKYGDDSALNPQGYRAENWQRENYKPIQKDSFSPVKSVDSLSDAKVVVQNVDNIPSDTLNIIAKLRSQTKLQTAREAFIYSEIFNRKTRF